MSDALDHLHGRGIVHSDLHLVRILHRQFLRIGYAERFVLQNNALIDDDGHLQLCDFGLAGFTDASKGNSLRGGHAGFVAPELFFMEQTPPPPPHPSSDIFSFASVCFHVSLCHRYISLSSLRNNRWLDVYGPTSVSGCSECRDRSRSYERRTPPSSCERQVSWHYKYS
jgi:serine/threonine protein kinase